MKELKGLPERRFNRFLRFFRRVIGLKPDETGGRSSFEGEGFGEGNFLCGAAKSNRAFFNSYFLPLERCNNPNTIFKSVNANKAKKKRKKISFYFPSIFRLFLKFANYKKRFVSYFTVGASSNILKNLWFAGRNKGILFRFGKGKRSQNQKEQTNCNRLFHLFNLSKVKFNTPRVRRPCCFSPKNVSVFPNLFLKPDSNCCVRIIIFNYFSYYWNEIFANISFLLVTLK